MTVYADASAILKLHLTESDSVQARGFLEGQGWASGRHSYVEVRRNLARLLTGVQLDHARASFIKGWAYVEVVDLSEAVAERSAALAEETGVRALDALHLGAAAAAGADAGLPVVTFDRRLANAARSLGWTVLGA